MIEAGNESTSIYQVLRMSRASLFRELKSEIKMLRDPDREVKILENS